MHLGKAAGLKGLGRGEVQDEARLLCRSERVSGWCVVHSEPLLGCWILPRVGLSWISFEGGS